MLWLPSSTVHFDDSNTDSPLWSASLFYSILVEVLLTGIYTVTFVQGWWALCERFCGSRKQDTATKLLVLASITMYLLVLAHISLDIRILYHDTVSSVTSKNWVDASPLARNPLTTAKFAMFVTETLIGDGFMIYRLYVVWDRRRVIVTIPLMILGCAAVIGYGVAVSESFGDFPPAFYLASFCVNLICTCLIMWRILRITKEMRNVDVERERCRFSLRRVVEAIVQSAAVYCLTSAVLVITTLTTEVGYSAALNMIPPIIGIVFSAIVFRIGKRRKDADTPFLPLCRTPFSDVRVDSASNNLTLGSHLMTPCSGSVADAYTP